MNISLILSHDLFWILSRTISTNVSTENNIIHVYVKQVSMLISSYCIFSRPELFVYILTYYYKRIIIQCFQEMFWKHKCHVDLFTQTLQRATSLISSVFKSSFISPFLASPIHLYWSIYLILSILLLNNRAVIWFLACWSFALTETQHGQGLRSLQFRTP